MKKADRLALAVRVEVASIRVDQVMRRTAPIEAVEAAVDRALQELSTRYGADYSVESHIGELHELVTEYVGGMPAVSAMELVAGMLHARATAQQAAAEATEALIAVLPPGVTLLEWCGCSPEELDQAVAVALES